MNLKNIFLTNLTEESVLMNNFKGDVCVTVNSHYLAKNNRITYLLAPGNLNSLRKKKRQTFELRYCEKE